MKMKGFWAKFFGDEETPGDKLDLVSSKLEEEVNLRRELAGKSVAIARTKQHDLKEALAKYEALEQAGITLQKQGKTDAVQYVAVELDICKKNIEQLTQEVNDLNAGAGDNVASYYQAQGEASQLLAQHGQLKAADTMNREMETMQKEMKALTGSSTATSAYKAIATEIRTKSNQFRAIAELESGDAKGKLVVARAMKVVSIQAIMKEIESKATATALTGTATSYKVIESAESALASDPIMGVFPLVETQPETGQADAEVVTEVEADQTEEGDS